MKKMLINPFSCGIRQQEINKHFMLYASVELMLFITVSWCSGSALCHGLVDLHLIIQLIDVLEMYA